MSILNLDYEIHMTERLIDASLDNCAENHFDGCQCTQAKIAQGNRLQQEYKSLTGRKWTNKVDLHGVHTESLKTRLVRYYAFMYPEDAAMGFDDVMPAEVL